MTPNFRRDAPLWFLIATAASAADWSAVGAHDYATWFFELFIGLGGVIALAPRFRFTAVVYGAAQQAPAHQRRQGMVGRRSQARLSHPAD